MAANDPQIHKRNPSNNGFDEVNGAAAIRDVIGAEPVTEYKDASFTAVVGRSYNVNEVGTPVVVTSPSGTEGASFNVFVQGGTVNVGGVNYTDGQTIKAHYVGGGWEYNLISAESTVGTALVTAASESAARNAIGAAPLDSPAFTNSPTAPTQAYNNDSTLLATTAMVQDVNEASGSRTTITASAAANYNITASSAQNRRQVVDVSATLTSGTATLNARTTNAQSGDERAVVITVSAGSGVFELRNATSGGTLLGTIYGDSTQSRVWQMITRYNGTAWGAATITPLNTVDYVSEMDAYRTPEAWTYIDGATTNRAAGVFTLGTRGNIAGVPTLDVLFDILVPPTNPAVAATIVYFSDNTGTDSRPNSMRVIFSGGAMQIRAIGTTTGDFRNFEWTGFRAAYSGQRVRGRIRFVQGSTNPVMEVGAVDISASFTATTGGTPPDWLSASMVATFALVGYNWPTGTAPRVIPILGTLSTAEDDNWILRGVIPAWVRAGGTAVNQISNISRNSDFSAGATDWTDNLGGSTGISVSGSQLVVNGANLGWVGPRADDLTGGAANNLCRAGVSGIFSFNYVSGSATSFQVYIGGTAQGVAVAATAGTRVNIPWVGTVNDAPVRIRANTTLFTLDNVSIVQAGALTLPEVTPDNILRDASQISPPIDGYTIGCTPQTNVAEGWIRARRTTDGFLMVDGQIVGPNRGIVQAMARSVSGGTITLGDTAGAPATLVASISLTAGVTTPLTLLKSITTGGKIYLDLGTATDAEIYLRTGPITSTLVN